MARSGRVGWASFCKVWAGVWLESLFLQVGDVMPVALTAVNDQRAVCFHSVMVAAASVGLLPPLLPPEVCDGPAAQWCEMLPSLQLASGEGRGVSGSGEHGQVHRFFLILNLAC